MIFTWVHKLALVLALVAGAFAYGVHTGVVSQTEKQAEEKAALQLELFDLADVLSVKDAELTELLAEKEELINELESQALEAPGASNPGIGSSGLQRLGERWGKR